MVERFDLIIVGGGMAGLALAALLQRDEACSHLRLALVDPQAPQPWPEQWPADLDPRVVALTESSRTLLEGCGAWQRIEAQRACAYHDMQVWDGEGTGSIHFCATEVQSPRLGTIVENSLLTAALAAAIEGSTVERISGRVAELNEGGLVLEDGRQLQADLVVAADGARSSLRSLAGLASRSWSYHQHAIVAVVECERPHGNTAWQRFLSSGPLAFLPLADGPSGKHSSEDQPRHCAIVWSMDDPLADELMALDDEAFAERLTTDFEARLGRVLVVGPRQALPLVQQHAVNYFRPGLVLVGDAAHSIHPLAGQGANLGFLDIQVLVEEIRRACRRQIPLSELALLRRYQRRRQAHNLAMMAAMEGFKRLFGSRNLSLRLLRNIGLNQVDSLPLLKQAIVEHALH